MYTLPLSEEMINGEMDDGNYLFNDLVEDDDDDMDEDDDNDYDDDDDENDVSKVVSVLPFIFLLS